MSTDIGTDRAGTPTTTCWRRTSPAGPVRPVTASVEMHLLHCGTCRAGVTPLVDPAPLRDVWDRVADELRRPGPRWSSGRPPGWD